MTGNRKMIRTTTHRNSESCPIDFVILWVDGSDPAWQDELKAWSSDDPDVDSRPQRFRDWGILPYWFRGVEAFAPWVRKIHFVTCGHLPPWLNTNHPKLNIVNHRDFMPADALPTFNSRALELNFHHIAGLSEHFVYFNDDFFLNGYVTPDYYFKHGLPCDNNAEELVNTMRYDPIGKFNIRISLYTNICVINGHFDRKDVVRQHFNHWFGFHLTLKDIMTSILLSLFSHGLFSGFRVRHYEQPYLKSVFDDAWDKESEMLIKSSTRFRELATLTPYFFRYWQLVSNKFHPSKNCNSRRYRIGIENMKVIENAMKDERIKSICLNDTTYCSEEDFIKAKKEINFLFFNKFTEKSQFEI